MQLTLDPQLVASGEYNRFYKSVNFVLQEEGGYVNDPSDPGGETKWGISKKWHPDVDILNMTPEQAANIYYNEYWVPSDACKMDYPDCVIVLDTAVNCGVSSAIRFMTPNYDRDAYLANRTMYYIQLVKKNPQEQKFLGAWMNRINELKKLVALGSLPQA